MCRWRSKHCSLTSQIRAKPKGFGYEQRRVISNGSVWRENCQGSLKKEEESEALKIKSVSNEEELVGCLITKKKVTGERHVNRCCLQETQDAQIDPASLLATTAKPKQAAFRHRKLQDAGNLHLFLSRREHFTEISPVFTKKLQEGPQEQKRTLSISRCLDASWWRPLPQFVFFTP